MGFAAGFFGKLSNDMTDQKQYIRSRVDEDRLYLREQGLKRQGAIQEQRGQYEQAARSLTNRGADERRVLNFLENNPSGLMELYRRTDSNNDITGAGLNDLMVISEDYQSEATMDDVLNKILPTIQAMPNDTGPVESRRRSIASWLGLDVDEAMTNQVYNQQIVGGMTGDQIMSSMNLPVQAQGSGTTSATLDLSSLSSANTISVGDANAYYDRANSDYNIVGEIDRLGRLINPEAGEPSPTRDEVTAYRADITRLEEIDKESGPVRLRLILESGLMAPGQNTLDLAGSTVGAQLFTVEMFGSNTRNLLGFGAEGDTSEAAVNASGVPAAAAPSEGVVLPQNGVYAPANPAAPTGLAPAVSLRPQDRPAKDTGAQVATTTTEAIESARVILEADPEAAEVLVPLTDGSDVTISRDQVPVLSVEESDDRAAYLEAIRNGDRLETNKAFFDFMAKYGADLALAMQKQAANEVAPDTPTTPTLEAPTVNPVADESMAVLKDAVTGVRPVGRLATVIEELNNPEVGALVTEMLREEDLNVRDRMITGIVALIRTSPSIPEGIEDFLQTLQGLRQTVSVNPQSGIGRAPTQPTLMQPSNENSGAPASITSATGATRSATPSSPARPGDGVNQSVNRYYDLLVNQDQTRNADQEMLMAALTSTDIDREELDIIAQNYENKYGADALSVVLNRANAQPATNVDPQEFASDREMFLAPIRQGVRDLNAPVPDSDWEFLANFEERYGLEAKRALMSEGAELAKELNSRSSTPTFNPRNATSRGGR
jgi:hypothetical protein